MAGPVDFILNGKAAAVAPAEDETLLETLRNRLGVTSVKDGCQPQGQCGCCLALVDGRPKVTCATKTHKVQGKQITTLDGIDQRTREAFSQAFAATNALQCGFCIPGIVVRGASLVAKDPEPSREAIAQAIDGHLCRCTGYVKIIDAIQLAAHSLRTGEPIPEVDDGRVGARLSRWKAAAMTLGERAYVDDLALPGMLHGAVVMTDDARALITGIDTAAAEAVPGVVRVATAADVPGERWYGLIYNDWPGLVAVGEETRCVGDVLAVVVAEDEATARAAAAKVVVHAERRDPACDVFEAMAPGAPQVNPKHPNVMKDVRFARGDVDAALAASAHVVTGTWQTQRIEHLFLEPESAVAAPRDDGKIHLWSQGQGVFDDRRQCAAFLGVPQEQIFAELVPNGGGFGGKEDMSVQAHAVLMAHLTGRPVKITLNREESIRLHPKRHPLTMTYTVGCDADGTLTALKADIVGDTGAYASVGGKVLERAAGHAGGPYRFPAVDVRARTVMTNNPPCGAMRGFGANQTNFALEGALDQLAAKVDLDGWAFRYHNAVEVGDVTVTGQVLEKSVGIKQTLEAVQDAFYAAKLQDKAVGLACGMKNSGIGNGAVEHGMARLKVEAPDRVTLYNGFTEMGQGLLTILTQCAVEVTGLPARLFDPRVDSTYALACGQTTGSRGTLLSGRAVTEAAEKLKADLDQAGGDLSALVGRVYAGHVIIDDTVAPDKATPGNTKTHTAYGFATQLVILDEHGHLERFVAAHDVGKALNPALVEGQIEGAVHMGLGFALSEELPCEDGMPVTFKLREIGPLRARDMPPVDVILVEDHEPEGPFGAKGVGEIGLVPTAGAVASALFAYDGQVRHTLPMKDSPAGQALHVGTIRSKGDRSRWR
ncbi:MAG: selenium-dependent xanthine dehydrogenase [Myxococcales bacterium]|nr:selenium-dependent xanthine dehydrogenase [Myxococcales bacterium]